MSDGSCTLTVCRPAGPLSATVVSVICAQLDEPAELCRPRSFLPHFPQMPEPVAEGEEVMEGEDHIFELVAEGEEVVVEREDQMLELSALLSLLWAVGVNGPHKLPQMSLALLCAPASL